MMEQIDRDVMRTHPDLHFFSGDDQTAITHREARTCHTSSAVPCPGQPQQCPCHCMCSLHACIGAS